MKKISNKRGDKTMITFFICVAILVAGYFTYGTIVDKILAPNDANTTPAVRLADGVDYVVLPWWKVLLTQFLNIAGLGPIFGAVLGALFGPIAFVWITLGCLFVGAVHDILVGYVSMKHDGLSISELVGLYLGRYSKIFMVIFTFILLVLVGVVFTMAPAAWLQNRIDLGGQWVWVLIILAYYVFATLVPVNTLIAKLFPILSIAMLLMCIILFVGIVIAQISGTHRMMEFTLDAVHAGGLSAFPFIFTTIACGAVSGFHATKSPMMARCIGKESEVKRVFFGSMVIEGVVALIWAAITIAVLGDSLFILQPHPETGNLVTAVAALGGQGGTVDYITSTLLPGWLAVILVFIAVIIFPITSADTGFRSIRLMFADAFKMDQSKAMSRVILCIPIFAIAYALTWVDFDIIWRYFAWSNLSIAAIALWTGAMYLLRNNKLHWIATLPATLLSCISLAYILQAPEGFRLNPTFSNIAGAIFAAILFAIFIIVSPKLKGIGSPDTPSVSAKK